MSTYEQVADLPLTIDGYELEGLAKTVSSGFERVTTVFRLRGGGEEGVGEDVTYEADDQRRQQGLGPVLDARRASGRSTRSRGTSRSSTRSRRRRRSSRSTATTAAGRLESAALDLALRQAGRSLPAVLGRELRARALRRLLAARRPADVRAGREPAGRVPGR